MLVTEIAAFSKAAHVENAPSVRNEQVSPGAANNHGRIPLGLFAPTVEYGLLFGAHPRHSDWV
jgi:hypothetical protein